MWYVVVKRVPTPTKWGWIASTVAHCAKHTALVEHFLLRQSFCIHYSFPLKAVSPAYNPIFLSYCIWFTSAEGNGNVQQWLWNLNRNPQGISILQANFQIWEKRSSRSSLGSHPQHSKGQNSLEYMSFLEFVQKGNCCNVRRWEWNTSAGIVERNIVQC